MNTVISSESPPEEQSQSGRSHIGVGEDGDIQEEVIDEIIGPDSPDSSTSEDGNNDISKFNTSRSC